MNSSLKRWCAVRALLGAIIAVSGCATLSTTQQGIVGVERKQYFADGARDTLSIASGDAYDAMLDKAMNEEKLNRNPDYVARVVAVANRLIPQTPHFRDDALGWDWEVNVLSDDSVNATCMAGGKIFVYTGLIEEIGVSDDELAAVIGHEIAHALREHSAESYSVSMRSQLIGKVLAAVAGAVIQSRTGVDSGEAFSQVGSFGAHVLGTLPYSREFETESDRIGLELMARASYDPQGAVTFWNKADEKSREKGGGNLPAFLSTHPSNRQRLEQMQANVPLVYHFYLEARSSIDSGDGTAAFDQGSSRHGNRPVVEREKSK